MPATYDPCDNEVVGTANSIIKKFYPELAEAGLTIRYLWCVNPEAVGGALKHHGYPAAAVVKINSYKDRVEGKTDCTITIDKEWWDGHNQLECIALLDHELHHILIAHDDDGSVITDDIGRPKVKLKMHDFQIGGFDAIAARHKLNAAEVQAIAAVRQRWVQADLDFSV